VNGACFFMPEIVALVAWHRWPDHAVDTNLACERRAEANRYHLVEEGNDFFGDVGTFKVASSSATFSRDTFGDGMKRDEGNWRLSVCDDLLKGREGVRVRRVQVVLINLICEKDKGIFFTKFDYPSLGVNVKERASGIAGVDDDKCFGRCAVLLSLFKSRLYLGGRG
jgi:hypothetical protein